MSEVRQPIPRMWQNRRPKSPEEKIAGKIIIKEERTRKVPQETFSFKYRKRRERKGLLESRRPFGRTGLGTSRGLLGSKKGIPTGDSRGIWATKIPKERLLDILPSIKKERNRGIARTATYSFAIKYSVVPTTQRIVSLLIFVIHNLINEHNSRSRHYSLGRTTLKNFLCIYLLL